MIDDVIRYAVAVTLTAVLVLMAVRWRAWVAASEMWRLLAVALGICAMVVMGYILWWRRSPTRNAVAGVPGCAELTRTDWVILAAIGIPVGLFLPLLDKKAPPEAKSYALEKYVSRLDYVEDHLKGRDYLLDHFSVADAYLVTVINWTMATPPIELAKWPALKAYYERLRARPSVAKAVAEEFELYKAEIARHKAAA